MTMSRRESTTDSPTATDSLAALVSELLAAYVEERETVIWEYSSRIREDLAALASEATAYRDRARALGLDVPDSP